MAKLVNVLNAKKYVELSQKDGASFNASNFVYYLPRTINQLCRLVGNDIVLKGMDVNASIQDNKFTVSVSPGTIIQDTTLIEIPSINTLDLEYSSNFDVDGHFVVFVQFQYLQTVQENVLKYGITYINQRGHAFDSWDHNKNRTVLNFYKFDLDQNNNIISLQESTSEYLRIHDKDYYKYGYNPGNITLFRYILWFLRKYQSPPEEEDTNVVDDLTVGGTLQVNGLYSNFNGDVNISKDLQLAGDLVTSGDNLFFNSENAEFASNELRLNRLETSAGINYNNKTSGGIRIERGLLPDAILKFDETDDTWKVGVDGQELIPLTKSNFTLVHSDILDWVAAFNQSFDDRFGIKTTDNLLEGNINKYYNEQRVVNDISTILKPGIGISISKSGGNIYITNSLPHQEYIHPETHPASIIVETENKQFVSSLEKISWNTKLDSPFTDTLHGQRSGGDLHPVVTSQTSGFMSNLLYDNFNTIWNDYQNGNFGNYSLPIASNTILGGIKIGSNINITQDGIISVDIPDQYSLPIASVNTLGGIKIGQNINITQDGTISVDLSNQYSLPIATDILLGGIKVGQNISITQDGTISIPDFTDTIHGQRSGGDLHQLATNLSSGFMSNTDKFSLTTLWQNYSSGNFIYNLPSATTFSLGGIMVGENLSIENNGLLSAISQNLYQNINYPTVETVQDAVEVIFDRIEEENLKTFKYNSPTPQFSHYINHNLNTYDLNVDILVFDNDTNTWNKDFVGISFIDENNITIDLTEKCYIRLILTKI